MLDIELRPLKDRIFDPLCKYMPAFVSPLIVTYVAFFFGLFACYSASQVNVIFSLLFWFLNRSLDCLDGALARQRGVASDLGGFVDLLGDFIIYSLVPIAIASNSNSSGTCFQAVAVLEASFHINNFVLFYIAAIAEKLASKDATSPKTKEVTSVMMRPALIEGMESGLLFTAMLAFPTYIETLSWLMAVLVLVGTLQRVIWIFAALG